MSSEYNKKMKYSCGGASPPCISRIKLALLYRDAAPRYA